MNTKGQTTPAGTRVQVTSCGMVTSHCSHIVSVLSLKSSKVSSDRIVLSQICVRFLGAARQVFFGKNLGFVSHVRLTKSEARAMAVTRGRRRGARFFGGPMHIFEFSAHKKPRDSFQLAWRHFAQKQLRIKLAGSDRHLKKYGRVCPVLFITSENSKMCIGPPKKRAPLRRPRVTAIARASLFVNHAWMTNPR